MAASRVEIEKIPYRILNELSAKLKTAEAQLKSERKAYEETIKKMSNDYAELAAKVSNRSELLLSPFDMNHNQVFESDAMAADSKLQDEVDRLKRKVAELVNSNNRYQIALSNCYCLPSVDVMSDASDSIDESILTSTPIPCNVSSTVVASITSSPALPCTGKETSQPVNVVKKDQVFVSRMVKVLSKLEVKYSTPPHKRKSKFFATKKRLSHIIPCEFFYYLPQPCSS